MYACLLITASRSAIGQILPAIDKLAEEGAKQFNSIQTSMNDLIQLQKDKLAFQEKELAFRKLQAGIIDPPQPRVGAKFVLLCNLS